jgi:RimJ/RimL family protein N-acetyltransferase
VTRSHPLPTLSDGRVLLRAVELQDLPAIEAGIHDPDVIRWIGPPQGSAQEVLVQNEERWAHGSPTLSICGLDGRCVGKVWMHIPENDPSTGFVGYWLLPVGRGRGLATSAVRLLSAWAMRELGVTNVRLTTAPDNERSHRVAERSGFRRITSAADGSLDGPGSGDVVYALDGPPASEASTSTPRLTEADGWLVAALTESSGRLVPLPNLIHDYDGLNRAIPTFDELSFGIPRLVAAGLASVGESSAGELVVAATPEAMRLRRSAKGHPVQAIGAALQAMVGQEDRSLGRLSGLTSEALDAAVAEHSSWVGRWSRPLVFLARLLSRWQGRRP